MTVRGTVNPILFHVLGKLYGKFGDSITPSNWPRYDDVMGQIENYGLPRMIFQRAIFPRRTQKSSLYDAAVAFNQLRIGAKHQVDNQVARVLFQRRFPGFLPRPVRHSL